MKFLGINDLQLMSDFFSLLKVTATVRLINRGHQLDVNILHKYEVYGSKRSILYRESFRKIIVIQLSSRPFVRKQLLLEVRRKSLFLADSKTASQNEYTRSTVSHAWFSSDFPFENIYLKYMQGAIY